MGGGEGDGDRDREGDRDPCDHQGCPSHHWMNDSEVTLVSLLWSASANGMVDMNAASRQILYLL